MVATSDTLSYFRKKTRGLVSGVIWVVVKIMVPFWIPIIIRPLIFRVLQKGTIILTTTHIGIYMRATIGIHFFMSTNHL